MAIEAKDLRHKTECNSKPFFSVATRKSYLIFAIYVRLYVCICMALGDSLYRYATYKSAPKTRIWRAEVKFWKHIGIGMTEVHNLTAAVGWRTMDWTWLLILVLGISTWFLLHFFSSIFHLLTRVQLSPGIELRPQMKFCCILGQDKGMFTSCPATSDIRMVNRKRRGVDSATTQLILILFTLMTSLGGAQRSKLHWNFGQPHVFRL